MTSPQPLREPRRCARRPRCVSRPRDAAPAVKPRAALGRCYADASSFVVPTSALATSARHDVVGSIPSCAAPLPKDPTAVAVVLLLDFLFFYLAVGFQPIRIARASRISSSASSYDCAHPIFDPETVTRFLSPCLPAVWPSCRVPWQTEGEDARGSKPTPSHGDGYEAPPDNSCGDGVAPGRGGGG